MFDVKEEAERLILVGVSTRENDDTEDSLNELSELVKTAGAQTAAIVVQNRDNIHPGTYIGKGKIEEVKGFLQSLDATGIVCDDELSPAQLKNLENELQAKVMDRTMVILDIFALHASTSEGKIQVELAQLKYRSTRLVGLRSSLSRLGGGIGTRGPGEKKLEVDRRLIRSRIAQLNKELENVKLSRETSRKQRSKSAVPVVSVVGYTNAGKSTLLNHLTGAGVLEEDKLFATLDTTTRNLELKSGQQILLTDTVGFIRKLPHHLVDAFRSTLEEAKYADIIVHVVDASNPDAEKQMHVVYDTLHGLGVEGKPIITVFNKQDLVEGKLEEGILSGRIQKDLRADRTVSLSAKSGEGMEELLEGMEELLRDAKVLMEKVFAYQDAGQIQEIRRCGQLLAEEYTEDGIYIKAYVPRSMAPF